MCCPNRRPHNTRAQMWHYSRSLTSPPRPARPTCFSAKVDELAAMFAHELSERGWLVAEGDGQRVSVGLHRRRITAGESGADDRDVLGHGVIHRRPFAAVRLGLDHRAPLLVRDGPV